VDERRTHYQVSFTPGQGLAVFLVLLGSLAGAYFFGLMTGLAGRDEPAGPDSPPAAAAAAPVDDAFPTPVLGIQPGAPRRAGAPPQAAPDAAAAPTGRVQLFEDRGEGEATVPASPGSHDPAEARRGTLRSPEPPGAAPPASAPSAPGTEADGGFWVQVVSLSSEREARARAARLVQRGYPAVLVPGPAAGKATVYRVRVGPFPRREEAARAAARLSAEEKTETWIVPSGR
jgi:cell division septation protein DedD